MEKKYQLSLVALLLLTFLSCTKMDRHTDTEPRGGIEAAQAWYLNQPAPLQVDWYNAVEASDKSRIIAPLKWSVTLEDGSKARRVLIVYQNTAGSHAAEIVEIIPTNEYWLSYGEVFKKDKFSGSLILYDEKLQIKYGQFYDNGQFKYQAFLGKHKQKIDIGEMNNARSCTWIQTGYLENGTYTVVNTLTCIVSTGGNPGGGGPVDQPPINCKVDPDNPTDCTGGSGGSEGDELVPLTTSDVSCASFQFRQTDPVNWQEAGVNRIRLHFVWTQEAVSREIYIDHMVFGLPMNYVGGKTLSPAEAAIATAIVVQRSKMETYREFRESPYFPSDEAITLFFLTKLSNNMKLLAGTAGKTGSGNPNIIFRDEERSMSPYECY